MFSSYPAAGEGFVSLFNGGDLTGWKAIVEDLIRRAKMSAITFAAAQEKADAASKSRSKMTPKPEICAFSRYQSLKMSINKYIPRICDTTLQNALNTMGAVLIEGAK